MIDKRLYKDVSDLLELAVSDDKITRIMMVRGFTTEQVKRVITDIRTKTAPLPSPDRKATPITETIAAHPSKRFGGLAKLFGKRQTDDEVLAEEVEKLVAHDNELKKEEALVHSQVKTLLDKAEEMDYEKKKRALIPPEVRDVMKMLDRLLEKMPPDEIERFSRSPQFEKYKMVMRKYIY